MRSTLGATTAKLNQLLNPASSPHALWVGPAYTGTSGSGGDGTWTDSGAAWRPDQFRDFFLIVERDNVIQMVPIVGNTQTVLDLGEIDLSEVTTGAYTIEAASAVSQADAEACILTAAAEVRSRLPERYRRMLSRIDEVVVEQAYWYQPSAVFSSQTTNADGVTIWRNPTRGKPLDINHGLMGPLDVTQGHTDFQDYTLSTADPTTVTFQLGGNDEQWLTKGDCVVARYDHDLEPAPRLLTQLTLWLAAHQILQGTAIASNDSAVTDHITRLYDQAQTTLDKLTEGKLGIDELDQIKLWQEYRTDGPAYRNVKAPRC